MADFTSIWLWVEEKLKLKMPSYIKDILRFCGYENCYTIATIGEDDLQYFQQQVRNGNVMKFCEGGSSGDSTKTVLEGLIKPEEFEFSRGHQKLIMSVVCLVKDNLKNGVDGFDHSKVNDSEKLVQSEKRKKAKKNRNQNEISEADTMSYHQEKLIGKAIESLRYHTRKLYTKSSAIIKATEPSTFVNVRRKVEGNPVCTGKIRCPYCKKKLAVFHICNDSNGLGSWNIGNFDRHLLLVHVKKHQKDKTSDPETEVNEMEDTEMELEQVEMSQGINVEHFDETVITKAVNSEDAFIETATVEIVNVMPITNNIITLPSLVVYSDSEFENDEEEECFLIEVPDSPEAKNSGCRWIDDFGTKVVDDKKSNENLSAEILVKIESNASNLSDDIHSKDGNAESTKKFNQQTETENKILLFRNGYKSQKMNTSTFTVNTCAFDSIFFIYYALYYDCPIYRKETDHFTAQSKVSGLIKKYFEELNSEQKPLELSDELYNDRNNILIDIFSDKYYQKSGNLIKNCKNTFVDCKTGIGGLFGRICFEIDQNFASAIELKICYRCEKTKATILPFISIDSKNVNVSNLQKSIRLTRSKDKLCSVCGRNCDTNTIYNDVLAMEVEPNSSINCQYTVPIQELTDFIKVGNKTYELFATVEYKPKNQHFVSHIKRDHENDIWNTFDDLNGYETDTDITQEILPYMMYYVRRNHNPGYKNAFMERLLSFFEQDQLLKPMIRKILPCERQGERSTEPQKNKKLNPKSAESWVTGGQAGGSTSKSVESSAGKNNTQKPSQKPWKY